MFRKILSKLPIHSRWRITIKTIPFLVLIIATKFLIHYFDYEFLTLNALFTAIISANIFLISFLISGTLVDYKESEKIPGDLASSLETMADEGMIIYKNHKSPEAKRFLQKISTFYCDLLNWFYKKEKTDALMQKLSSFNNDFLSLEPQTQANFIVRLKQEQNSLRKMITRIHTIRETSFLGTGYAIVEIITFILVFGLIFIKFDPFYESVFFISFVSFILIYMLHFIKDLDNPFGYYEQNNLVEDVSLSPILKSQNRIDTYIKTLKK
jgi:hypothetical protein